MAEGLSLQSLNISNDLEKLISKLKYHFKHPFFKNDTQRDVIKKILERKCDVFITLPTGFGKSLCYQFPAVLHAPKVTIVVYSLPHRMKNTVDKLKSLNIRAEIFNEQQYLNNQTGLVSDSYSKNISSQLLYVFINQAITVWFQKLFMDLINEDKLAYVVVDEVESEIKWIYGQKNFYGGLGSLKKLSLNIPWIILINRVGSNVVNLMITLLNLRTDDSSISIITAPSFKKNIYFDVKMESNLNLLYQHLKEFLDDWMIKSIPESCGMIFCKTSKVAEQLSAVLGEMGVSITPYHNNLTMHRIQNIQAELRNGTIKVIAVTGAFGMTINCANLNLVVHWGLPLNLLEYYKQTAEAGKNSKPSHCRIYVTKQALSYYNNSNQSILVSEMKKSYSKNAISSHLLFDNSRAMKDYCENLFRCRHKYFADYFGDEIPLCNNMCDVCEFVPKRILQAYKEKDIVRERGALNILKKFLKDYEDLKKNDNTIPSETINVTKVVSDELVENTKTNCTGQSSSEEINLHVPKNINNDENLAKEKYK